MIMLGKDVSFVTNPIKFCLSLFVSEVYLWDIWGQQGLGRVCLGVCPPGLLTPTIPCCNIQSIHRELRVTGIELKRINNQNSVRLRTILFGNKGNN